MRLQDTDFTDRLPASYKTAEAKEYAYSSRVEVCSCPEGHIGSSCETCKDGYYWDRASPNPNQKCKKCKCHGHCDKCDDEGYPFITERQWDSQVMSASGAPEDSVQIYYSQLNYSADIPIERYSYEIPAGLFDEDINDKKRCKHNTVGKECQFCAGGLSCWLW